MNKGEFISRVKDDLNISNASAKRVVDTVFNILTEALKEDDGLMLAGFGTLKTTTNKARKARNPRTGEMTDIPAKRVAKFKASQKLKQILNA